MSENPAVCSSGLRMRRKGCNEECLRRIAVRLCHLSESCASKPDRAQATGCCESKSPTREVADECCGPILDALCSEKACKGRSSDVAQSSTDCPTKSTSDSCCKPEQESQASGCKGEVKESICLGKSTGVTGQYGEENEHGLEKLTSENCCEATGAVDCQSTKSEANGCGVRKTEERVEHCIEENKAAPVQCEKSCADDCCSAPSVTTDDQSCKYACCTQPHCEAASFMDACSRHLEDASAQFQALLQNGLCLCRKVRKQLGFCCCCSGGASVVAKRSSACKTSKPGTGKAMGKTCTSANDAGTINHAGFSCQSSKGTKSIATPPGHLESASGDVEKGASGEDVTVRVSGMTCTGCSKKLTNVLTKIPGVSKVDVVFVSGMAKWHLNNGHSIDDVLKRVERETGFTLDRVVVGFQHLNIHMSDAAATQLGSHNPDGLVSISKANKGMYELVYDPHVTGARSLMPPGATLAPPSQDKSVAEGRRRLRNMAISFGLSVVLTIPIVVLNWGRTGVRQTTSRTVSLILATGVQAIAVPEFYVRAIKSLVYSRVLEMDLLVVLSITAAYVYSVVAFGLTEAGVHVEQEAFFETSSLLITLVLLGRLMSAIARLRAVSAVSLRSLQADLATLLSPTGQVSQIDARLLQFGDTIRVPPHTRVVTDGRVVSGESAVDESMITGESTLIRKHVGDEVIAGTMNNAGTLHVSLTRLPGANSIADISGLVESAIGAKPRIQDLADKLAGYFVPVVIVVSLIIFCIWIGIAIGVRGYDGGSAVGLAITYGIAALAVSCPCALGLAVPMVLVIAGGVAARAGVIIKAADATERGYKTTDVVFDKTGTLTTGELQVAHAETYEAALPSSESFSVLKLLVEANEHPVAKALALHLVDQPNGAEKINNIVSVPGAGIQATTEQGVFKAGNPYWLATNHRPEVVALLNKAMTVFCVTLNDEPLLLYGLNSSIRPEAFKTVKKLQNRGIICHVVSGDAPKAVEDVARVLGIEPGNVMSRSTPGEKQKYVQGLQTTGKRVLFVGDGTNDAVAVAQANVGVQIGSASDVTGAIADVVLLGGLDGVVTLLEISKRAFRRITFNFAWTVIYNVFAILLAAGAFVKFRIPPAYAGLGEIASVAPVIIAAITLTYPSSITDKA